MIVLSGGTGTPKLIQGLRQIIPDEEITVIVNTAEDIWISGNLVSPDVDTVLYLFSGLLDDRKWWGIKNDTYKTNERLKELGLIEKLMIGDKDRVTHIFRSELIRNGANLTEATLKLSSMMGIKAHILPMCDEKVDTMITTPEGIMHFQDFWISARGEPEVLGIEISGINRASPSKEVLKVLGSEEEVIIGPSNPVTSIGPILALPGMKDTLKKKKVIAISPIIGNSPVSGPAGKLMKGCKLPVSSRGVTQCYEEFLDIMVIDKRDDVDERSFPVRTVRFDTMMTSIGKSEALARSVLRLFRSSNVR